MRLVAATADLAGKLAQTHQSSFGEPWSAPDIKALLGGPGGFGLAALDGDDDLVRAFILARTVADEAEILTLAVEPARRRQGLASLLVEAAAGLAANRGALSMFLEVAVDNPAATSLYRATGFADVGRRRGYYSRTGAAPVDALIMRRDLNTAPT